MYLELITINDFILRCQPIHTPCGGHHPCHSECKEQPTGTKSWNTVLFEQVIFNVEDKECIRPLHIIIDGLVDMSFNVTSSYRERGEVIYDLSHYISPDDVMGVVYGRNDIGDSSTPVELQAAGGKVNNY